VNDDVAGIDKNPIALGQAFHAHSAIARFFQSAREVLGGGGDMALRAPGCDDDRIAQRRAAFEVDGDDLLGLVVVERFEDAG